MSSSAAEGEAVFSRLAQMGCIAGLQTTVVDVAIGADHGYRPQKRRTSAKASLKMEVVHKVDDVFGITRELPINYVERDGVDNDFSSSLGRKRHVVIYGSSKQGKTSLRKRHLSDDDYILVSCQNKWSSETLALSILKQAGFQVEVSNEKAISGTHKVKVSLAAEGGLPLVSKAKGQSEYDYTKSSNDKVVYQPLSLDPLDINDIIHALKSVEFKKYIILEDFHYLPQETQADFSYSLKSFHENSDYVFVIVGVWREENRLIGFNGDLTDRVQSINADTWTPAQLNEVIEVGEKLLNVHFETDFKAKIIEQSLETVHLVQEACRSACREFGVFETVEGDTAEISHGSEDALRIVQELVNGQSGRYQGALQNISEGFQSTDLEMPKWIIYALLCFEDTEYEKGVKLRRLSRVMKAKHPRGAELNNGSITQTLKGFGSLQNEKSVRPPIFDYDTTNRVLSVVDKGFIIWLKSQDRSVIAEDLDMVDLLSFAESSEIAGPQED